ncbi:MAG: hypothetical protein Q8K78_11930 [Planctomycetaceae bacterium]|nr:hypothetical protein [Planctomycetaceae bacterium]
MFYAPPYSMPQGRFILSSTSGPDDAKLRAVLNQFLAAIGLPAIAPDADLVEELQARAGQLQAGGRPPSPLAMASRLRNVQPSKERRRREIAERIAKHRNITVEAAMKFIPD